MRPDQVERYARHIVLKEIGGPGQQRLLGSSVSLIGAGALGGPCAMYLAAAGVGRIEIWDDDTISLSNLQRQVQFETGDDGKAKVDVLAGRLKRLNPDVDIVTHMSRFDVESQLSGEVLIDGSDNFETRFALNALAVRSGRLLVSGAVGRWSAQVGVFAAGVASGAACYRCFVPQPPPDAATCSEVGIVGALTGVAGSQMALSAIGVLSGAVAAGESRLFLFDGLAGTGRTVKVGKDGHCPVCSASQGLSSIA